MLSSVFSDGVSVYSIKCENIVSCLAAHCSVNKAVFLSVAAPCIFRFMLLNLCAHFTPLFPVLVCCADGAALSTFVHDSVHAVVARHLPSGAACDYEEDGVCPHGPIRRFKCRSAEAVFNSVFYKIAQPRAQLWLLWPSASPQGQCLAVRC